MLIIDYKYHASQIDVKKLSRYTPRRRLGREEI
jgi:hypothetical protein